MFSSAAETKRNLVLKFPRRDVEWAPLESERVKLITKNAVEHSTTDRRGTNCFQRIQYAFKNIVSVGTVVHRSPLHDRQHCGR